MYVQLDNSPPRPFLLFATLFEASMIDKQLENKPIYFEISIGTSAYIDSFSNQITVYFCQSLSSWFGDKFSCLAYFKIVNIPLS